MRILERDARTGADDAFVQLPHALYAGDPCWIPDEEHVLRASFSAANDWFARGCALALCVPGRARLAVFRAPDCRVDGRPAAFFGYFEAGDDAVAAGALLERASEWARAAGAEVLYGPVDFDTLGRYRLRTAVEPGGGLPFPGEPYGRPCYPAMLEDAGFSVVRRYTSQLSRGAERPDEGKWRAAQALLATGYTIESLTAATWMRLLPDLHRHVDAAFTDAFAYLPASFGRFAALQGAGVARRLCPYTSVLAYAADGELAGFMLVFPHYGPLAVQGAGRARVAASALCFEEHAATLARCGPRVGIVKSVGIAPAHRQRGVMDALAVAVLERGQGHYDRWMAALIREKNHSARYGGRRQRLERSYALYAKLVRASGGVEP